MKRRELFRKGAAALVGAAIVGKADHARADADAGADAGPAAAEPDAEAPPTPENVEATMTRRWGMVIDLDRCTACGSCTVACRQENNVPTVVHDEEHRGTQIEWMSMLWQEPEQDAMMPTALPFPCQHCTNAPCVKVCPVGATYKDPNGITMQIWERCIGCRYCMVACPYGRRSFNWEEPEWPGTLAQMLNPDVATRPDGVVEKCTFCHHRIRKVGEGAALEGRAIRDDEMQRITACSAACPAEAIVFGDLSDPDSKVAALARSPRRFRLLEHLGTEPGVIYLKRDLR